MFVTFLTTPTIVSMVEDEADISVFYSFTEEEIHKEMHEIKAGPSEFQFTFLLLIKNKTLINSKYLQRHDNVFGDIFLPPPEQV